MLPREHGAYFQLAIPLLAAAFSQPPGLAGAALLVASCLAFLAPEPLLILLGARGPRRRQVDATRARARFASLAIGALALGAIGLALAPSIVFAVAIPAAAAAAALIAMAARRSVHTLGGELIAAVALPGASAVVLVASGAPVDVAALQWLGWAIGFGATVIAVHRVLARHKRPATAVDPVLAIALLVIATLLVAIAGRSSTSAIAIPLVLLATATIAAPPRATRLRALGIAIATTAALSAALGVMAT